MLLNRKKPVVTQAESNNSKPNAMTNGLLVDFLRRAGDETCSLINEGYIIRVRHFDKKKHELFVALVHCRNGNIIRLYAYPNGLEMYKNDKLIKSETL